MVVLCIGCTPWAQSVGDGLSPASYELALRYGNDPCHTQLADSTAYPCQAFLSGAHRLDLTVAVPGAGRIVADETRLVYASGPAGPDGAIPIDLELSYASSHGHTAIRTHVSVRPGVWIALAGSHDVQHGPSGETVSTETVFMRIRNAVVSADALPLDEPMERIDPNLSFRRHDRNFLSYDQVLQ
ncbi:hypothetical protein T31B1_11138 [Salinisphaera sp. T31B1]